MRVQRRGIEPVTISTTTTVVDSLCVCGNVYIFSGLKTPLTLLVGHPVDSCGQRPERLSSLTLLFSLKRKRRSSRRRNWDFGKGAGVLGRREQERRKESSKKKEVGEIGRRYKYTGMGDVSKKCDVRVRARARSVN